MIADQKELHLLVIGSSPDARIFDRYPCFLREIISRQPNRIDAYLLDRPSKIIFENGKSVGETISLTEIFRTYLLSLEEVDLSGVNLVLKGSMNRYHMYSNTLSGPLEKVIIHLSSFPTSKTREPIGPF